MEDWSNFDEFETEKNLFNSKFNRLENYLSKQTIEIIIKSVFFGLKSIEFTWIYFDFV